MSGYDAEATMKKAGVTYRELDHWTSRGYLTPEEQHPGIGRRRRWSKYEVEVARVARRLRDAGFRIQIAVDLARDAVYGKSARPPLGPGIHLTVQGVLQACDASIGDVTNGARFATGGPTGPDLNDRAGKEKRDAKGDA